MKESNPPSTSLPSPVSGEGSGKGVNSALLTLSALYLGLALFYLPATPVWLTDIGQRYIQAANIHFTPGLDLAIGYPGRWLDPDFRFFPFNPYFFFISGDRALFAESASVPFLGGLLMKALGPPGGLLPPLAAGLICAWLAGRLARSLAPGWGWASTLLVGLGTPVAIYGFGFWEHTLAAALAVGAVTVVVESPSARGYVWAGVLAGLAAAVRKQLVLFMIALAAATLLDLLKNRKDDPKSLYRNLVAFGAGASFIILLTLLINLSQTGRLIPPEVQVAAQFELASGSFLTVNDIGGLAQFLFDPPVSWLALAALAYSLARFFPIQRAREIIQIGALLTIGLGVWNFFSTAIRDPVLHGLLLVCPGLLVSTASDFSTRPARLIGLTALIFFGLAVLSLGLLTWRGPAQGEQEWGPRYLIAVYALAAPLVIAGLKRIYQLAQNSWLARLHLLLAIQLVVFGIFIQALGFGVIRTAAMINAERQAVLSALPDQVILTTEPWLAPSLPGIYLSKEVYLVDSEEDWRIWITAARSRGVARFAWVTVSTDTLSDRYPVPGLTLAALERAQLPDDFLHVNRYEITSAP